jgi:acid phosphatase (class A)
MLIPSFPASLPLRSMRISPRQRLSWLWLAALVFVFSASARLFAQAPATSASPAARSGAMHRPGSGVSGYLPEGQVNFLSILPPYPALDSAEDRIDVATLLAWRQPDGSARWRLAEEDANLTYTRFNEAFGLPIDPVSSPLVVHLLDRVEADISSSLNGAKGYYHRPRPYQRFRFDHVCEFAQPPVPDMTKGGNSYPSGHAAFGWAIALTLAQVAPDKAQTVLIRGREYGDSRIVCAAHYPSDVHFAQVLVSAAFGRLQTQPEFLRDLGCARQEYALASHLRAQMSPVCLALKEQVSKGH